jgi:hypothetical protein
VDDHLHAATSNYWKHDQAAIFPVAFQRATVSESPWGRQLTYDSPEQRFDRSLPRESVVPVGLRREREPADDEAPQHLLRLPDVSHQQLLPVLQVAVQLLPHFGRVDSRLRRTQGTNSLRLRCSRRASASRHAFSRGVT